MSDRQTRNLLCYASGHGHDWEAICLDLDIAVQGQSFDEVFNDLNEAIALYLESVRELPEAERAELLHRSAPLGVRLKFLWQVILSLFNKGRGGDDCHGQFTVPCAA